MTYLYELLDRGGHPRQAREEEYRIGTLPDSLLGHEKTMTMRNRGDMQQQRQHRWPDAQALLAPLRSDLEAT